MPAERSLINEQLQHWCGTVRARSTVQKLLTAESQSLWNFPSLASFFPSIWAFFLFFSGVEINTRPCLMVLQHPSSTKHLKKTNIVVLLTFPMTMNEHVHAPTGTRVATENHARLGIGKPHPKETREQVNKWQLLGLPVLNPEINQLHAAGKYPCRSSCCNWRELCT